MVDKVFEALKSLGDPFAIDAFYYIDRDEPKLKKCLLGITTGGADDKEGEMSEYIDAKLEVALPADKMQLLKKVAKEEFDVDEYTLAKIWIIEQLTLKIRDLPAPAFPSALPSEGVDLKPTEKTIENRWQLAIPKDKRGLFPETDKKITLAYDGVEYKRSYNPKYGEISLAKIYESGISSGDIVRVTPLQPGQKYRVEVIKQGSNKPAQKNQGLT